MAEVLALVDVDSESAPETWPLLLEAVRSAHFTALDLELSGLGDVIGRGKGHTIHTRYSDACEVVKTRAMLSLGVACYRWKQPLESREGVQNTHFQYACHTAEPFATTPQLMRKTTTPTETETALERNDAAAVPLERSDTLEETAPDGDGALVLEETGPGLEESARGRNDTLALGKEAGPGIPVLEDSAHGEDDVVSVGVEVKVFNVWLMCQRPYTIDPSSAHFLVQHGFDFNRQFARGIPYTPGPMEVQQDEKRVCLHHLLATILAAGKPLVVHNGWIDLLFLYGNLYSPLPPSLGTLMADFSEMFVGGVYDTKAIAQYQIPQEATFLEYLFRKCQRDNEVLTSRGSPHIKLHQPSLSSSVQTESVVLSPPPSPSLEELADITLCENFSRYGFCNKASCPNSHNVLSVLAHHEHQLRIRDMRRKRKRKDEKKQASVSNGEERVKQHCSSDSTTTATHRAAEKQQSLAEHFATELAAARQKLETSAANSQTSHLSGPHHDKHIFRQTSSAVPTKTPAPLVSTTSPTPTITPTVGSELQESAKGSKQSTDLRPSYGHRAGFDAFMTGYVFAHFATTTQTNCKQLSTASQSLAFDEAMIEELSSMRNRLSNRNRPVPLIMVKSQFDNTSPGHRENCAKIAQLRELLFNKESSSHNHNIIEP